MFLQSSDGAFSVSGMKLHVVLFYYLLVQWSLQVSFAQAPGCSTQRTLKGRNVTFLKCQTLEVGDAAIAWTLSQSRGGQAVIDVAFSGDVPSETGWFAWGINPRRLAMVGTTALIAFRNPQGVPQLDVYSVSKAVKEDGDALLPQQLTEVQFRNQGVEMNGRTITIFATVTLQTNGTVVNHVWNWGNQVINRSPQSHDFQPSNTQSLSRIDMVTGELRATGLSPRQRLKNIHGLLNAVGWGIAIPLGIMSARYLRPFPSANPAWFYVHVMIQITGYGTGVAGWVIGIKLGADSLVTVSEKHRIVGYAVFICGTLQILALLVRPRPYEKIRFYWNIYHQSVGYSTLALGLANIFIGLDILKPAKRFRTAFIAVLIALAAVCLVAEVVTWVRYFRRRYLIKVAAARAASRPPPKKERRSVWDRMLGRR